MRRAQQLCELHEAGRLGLDEEVRWVFAAYLRATGRLSEYPAQVRRGEGEGDAREEVRVAEEAQDV